MDHRTALERLDAVRPGSDDLAQPELASAAELLTRDAALAAEFRRRQIWDRRIVAAMHDVAVPADLRVRLLEHVASTASTFDSAEPRRFHRRRFLAAATGLAAGVAAGGLYLFNPFDHEPVTVVAMRDAAGALLAQRIDPVPFTGHFTPELPPGGLSDLLRFDETVLGLLEQQVAAWRFRADGHRPLRGVLAAAPVEAVVEPPTARSLSESNYIGAGNAVSWSEGRFVYVCCVDRGINELLQRLNGGPIA